MKILKNQKKVFGWADIVISILLFLLSAINYSSQKPLDNSLLWKIYLTVPYIVMGILVYFFDRKYMIAVVLFIIGTMAIIDPSNFSDFSASAFFYFSWHMIKKYKYAIFLYAITVFGVAYRATMMDITIYRSFGILLAFTSMYALYYFIILKDNNSTIKGNIKSLTKKENKLLEYMCNGDSQENAGSKIGHKRKQETSKMMKNIREKLNIEKQESNYKVISTYLNHGKLTSKRYK